jgi:hypothetical protein
MIVSFIYTDDEKNGMSQKKASIGSFFVFKE